LGQRIDLARSGPGGVVVTREEELIDAWGRLVKSLAEKEGITASQAEHRARKFFPELYELYEKAKGQREG
jgi:hypothetical protein